MHVRCHCWKFHQYSTRFSMALRQTTILRYRQFRTRAAELVKKKNKKLTSAQLITITTEFFNVQKKKKFIKQVLLKTELSQRLKIGTKLKEYRADNPFQKWSDPCLRQEKAFRPQHAPLKKTRCRSSFHWARFLKSAGRSSLPIHTDLNN